MKMRKRRTESRNRNGNSKRKVERQFSVVCSQFLFPFLFSVLCFLFSFPILAQSTQFYLEDSIGQGLTTRIYLIGPPEAKAQVQEALYGAVDHARETLTKMQTELEGIHQQKTKGNIMVSPELAKAVHTGLELSQKTNGSFDITAGHFKKVKVNLRNNSIKMGGEAIQIDLSPILKGFVADLLADDLLKAGWTNCLVKIENIYVTRGTDIQKPWSIPVVVPSEKVAKRVLYYKTKKDQAAGATFLSTAGADSNLKSVTIFSKNGADAEGLASTVYRMGLEEGKKFLSANKSLSAILVDNQGQLTNVP